MNNCNACSEPTLSDESVFTCAVCKGISHLHCSGVAETSYRRLTKERRAQIRCKKCLSDTPAFNVTASGASTLDNELLLKQNAIFDQNTQILATISAMSKQYEDILLRVHELENINKKLEKKNCDLEARLEQIEGQFENLDRENRSKNAEIRGIPEISGEDLKNVVFNIQKITNAGTEVKNVEAAYRTGQKTNKDLQRPIILRFKTNDDRDSFLNDIKTFNKRSANREDKLNTNIIGMAGKSSQIYISEHLTFRAKHHWFLARKAARDNIFKFAWIRGGQVYVRKDVGTPVILINEKTKNLLSPSPNNS